MSASPELHQRRPGDVLIVIDVQNDFCPGGALAVPAGDEVIPVINGLASHFEHVVLTQDWHPAAHSSFASSHPGASPFTEIAAPYGSQTLWPDHCVQGTRGAQFHASLHAHRAQSVLRKGFRQSVDSYSAFFEIDRCTPTGLAGYLRERGLERVFFCGLAFDFCVRWSAVDAVRCGFETFVVEDACRSINLNGSVKATREEFSKCTVKLVKSADMEPTVS